MGTPRGTLLFDERLPPALAHQVGCLSSHPRHFYCGARDCCSHGTCSQGCLLHRPCPGDLLVPPGVASLLTWVPTGGGLRGPTWLSLALHPPGHQGLSARGTRYWPAPQTPSPPGTQAPSAQASVVRVQVRAMLASPPAPQAPNPPLSGSQAPRPLASADRMQVKGHPVDSQLA